MVNPYQASRATLPGSTNNAIDTLDVSETWKRRFRLIERAGGVHLPRLRQLGFGERMQANVNLLAFLLGPIYFGIKGMWKLALTYLGCVLILMVVLVMLGLENAGQGAGIGLGVAFGARANVNYYSKKVLGIDRWF